MTHSIKASPQRAPGVFEIRPVHGPIYLSGNGRRHYRHAFGSVLASFGRPTIAIGSDAISSVSGAHHRPRRGSGGVEGGQWPLVAAKSSADEGHWALMLVRARLCQMTL